jgi:hypothetical protein
MSKRTRGLLAGALVAVGLVWVGQGVGLIRGSSFMVDDLRWAIIGAVAVVTGLVLGWSVVSGRRP